jgi:calcineurin-like phosphoesterase family protein
MPDPDKIIRMVDRAAAACRETPGRRGRLVSLDSAEDVLVAGDLHGHVGHFQFILEKANLAKHPCRHLVLQELIHGPFLYPRGGDKSHQLLDLFAALKVQYPDRVHFLPGNHEFAQITNRPIARCAGELNSIFYAGVTQAYGSRAVSVAVAYKRLILAAPLGLRTPNNVFISHSIPPLAASTNWSIDALTVDQLPDDAYLPGGPVFELVWGRDVSLEAATQFLDKVGAKLLVTGHLPCETGFKIPNDRHIVLDSQEPPAGYCLFPTNKPISHADLVACVTVF